MQLRGFIWKGVLKTNETRTLYQYCVKTRQGIGQIYPVISSNLLDHQFVTLRDLSKRSCPITNRSRSSSAMIEAFRKDSLFTRATSPNAFPGPVQYDTEFQRFCLYHLQISFYLINLTVADNVFSKLWPVQHCQFLWRRFPDSLAFFHFVPLFLFLC